MVYFDAGLWKVNIDWLDGTTIVKGIFLCFEEQGVAKNVPWAADMCQHEPSVLVFIAVEVCVLDGVLAYVLACLPPGHKM